MDVPEQRPTPPPADSSAESGPTADWAELTLECLINILSRLTLEQLWTGPMLVCKSWLRACTDPSLHSTLDLEARFESSPESIRWWSPEFERRVDSVLRSVVGWSGGGLTAIRARHCSDRALGLVAERCPKLQVLSIRSCQHVTNASMARIAVCCTNLRELDISYCYEVSHESLVLLGSNCPNLKVLKRNLMECIHPSQYEGVVPIKYMYAFPQDGDSEAGAIGKFMPGLEHLEICFSKLTTKGLMSICDGCLELVHLDLSGCTNLTSHDIVNATLNLKNLREIIKPNCYIPWSVFYTERYGHWSLYAKRFQTDVFRI